MTPGRTIVVLALALALVCGLGYVASRTWLAGPRGGEALVRRQHVPAPAPPPARAPVAPAGAPVGMPVVDPAWVSGTAVRAGIPEPALRAYAVAQLAVEDRCGIGWTTLAGIGWVESQHGTIGGRVVTADGTSSREILGPALDGRGDVAAVPATRESARWHGDRRWDHALGPMQFIPGTWRTWGSDGDGDGVADPHDLDDAAYSAARYLCGGGHDLATGSGWSGAVLTYNRSRAYVDAVHAAATSYADRAGR